MKLARCPASSPPSTGTICRSNPPLTPPQAPFDRAHSPGATPCVSIRRDAFGAQTHPLASPRHAVMAQIVPMRRCNLSCAYCNEYDDVSKPVPLDEMLRRIDHLARL